EKTHRVICSVNSTLDRLSDVSETAQGASVNPGAPFLDTKSGAVPGALIGAITDGAAVLTTDNMSYQVSRNIL
ncbi:MAG: hypothetical protein ABJQ19_22730, partial [Paracoccaceae bacterium]